MVCLAWFKFTSRPIDDIKKELKSANVQAILYTSDRYTKSQVTVGHFWMCCGHVEKNDRICGCKLQNFHWTHQRSCAKLKLLDSWEMEMQLTIWEMRVIVSPHFLDSTKRAIRRKTEPWCKLDLRVTNLHRILFYYINFRLQQNHMYSLNQPYCFNSNCGGLPYLTLSPIIICACTWQEQGRTIGLIHIATMLTWGWGGGGGTQY